MTAAPEPLQLDTLDALTSLLSNELRAYHKQYPDADYMDLSGYIVGFMNRPQTKAFIASELQKATTARAIEELKTLWNATQPDTVPEGWTPETEEAKYILKRLNQLRKQQP